MFLKLSWNILLGIFKHIFVKNRNLKFHHYFQSEERRFPFNSKNSKTHFKEKLYQQSIRKK